MKYQHPLTPEKEYPLTAREILHASFDLLIERNPQETVRGLNLSFPAYEWYGAGSEKGGSAEVLKFDSVIVLPHSSNISTLLSVAERPLYYSSNPTTILLDGDPQSFHPEENITSGRGYSVIFRLAIPSDQTAEILSFHSKELSNLLRNNLKKGVHQFRAVPIFAYDQPRDNTNPRDSHFLCEKSRGFDPFYSLVAESYSPVYFGDQDYLLDHSLHTRRKVIEFFADFMQGKGKESPLMTPDLARAQHNIYHLPRGYKVS